MRFIMINFKLIKTLITILFFYTTILFATVLENNQKDLICSTKHGDSILLISGENFKKTEPENWISYKNTYIRLLYYKVVLPPQNKVIINTVARSLEKKYQLTKHADDFKAGNWSGIKLSGIINGEKCFFYIVKQKVYFLVFAIHHDPTKLIPDDIAKKLLDKAIPFSPIVKKEKDGWFVRVVAKNMCYQFLCPYIAEIAQDDKDFLIITDIDLSLVLIPYKNISVQKIDKILKHEFPDSRQIYTNITDQRNVAILYSKFHNKFLARIYNNNNVLFIFIEEIVGNDFNKMLNYIKMIANTLEFIPI